MRIVYEKTKQEGRRSKFTTKYLLLTLPVLNLFCGVVFCNANTAASLRQAALRCWGSLSTRTIHLHVPKKMKYAASAAMVFVLACTKCAAGLGPEGLQCPPGSPRHAEPCGETSAECALGMPVAGSGCSCGCDCCERGEMCDNGECVKLPEGGLPGRILIKRGLLLLHSGSCCSSFLCSTSFLVSCQPYPFF